MENPFTEGLFGRGDWLRAGLRGLGGIVLALAALPAQALDYQLHGFAAQGFAYSSDNNVLGDSRQGSFDFNELGVNGAVDFGHGWLASGQVVVRNAGEADDGDVRLDYGLVDYRAFEDAAATAGLRLGKVRVPYGLFNDTRDVVFTRPGILLPDSVYSDLSAQQRSLLFSREGGQAYGQATLGPHDLSLVFTQARSHTFNRDEKRALTGDDDYDAVLNRLWTLRLMDEIDGGRWQFAFTYLNGAFDLRDADPFPFSVDATVSMYLLSARYNAPRYSLIAEYLLQEIEQRVAARGFTLSDGKRWPDGGYLQADLRLTPQWTAMARLDAQFADRDDRDGRDCEGGTTPENRHACYSLDATVGLRWQPDPHWGVWGEYHRIDGYYNKLNAADNQGREPAAHWDLFLLMLGYRF